MSDGWKILGSLGGYARAKLGDHVLLRPGVS